MIIFLKKHKIITLFLGLTLVLDILVITLALIPSNKDITTPGGLNEVKTLINVDTNTNLTGSFNTIYVYSIERGSVLQTIVASFADYNDITDSSVSFHLTDEESLKAGQVQKNQSIEASLICAYRNAKNDNITINYDLSGFIVRNYQINHKIFKIGDIITSITDTDGSISNLEEHKLNDSNSDNIYDFTNEPNELYSILTYPYYYITEGDIVTFLRDGVEVPVEINEEYDFDLLQNYFFVYPKYEIKTASPSFTLYPSKTLGPSGGLMQTLSIYCQITGNDLTKGLKIVGTGTIDVNGNVGEIGGIEQKIATAAFNDADIFLCPSDNWNTKYENGMITKSGKMMKIYKVNTFSEAISYLEGLYV